MTSDVVILVKLMIADYNCVTMDKKENISKLLADLESAIGWFEKQKDLDLEEGLKKVREGAGLIKELKKRLQDVENEFNDIKKELENS